VMTVLDKRSAANVVIRTAAIKLLNKVKGQQAVAETATTATTTTDTVAQTANTAATTASTVAIKAKNVAMKILNKTILANPVMWLVAGLAALAAGLMAIVSHSKKAAEAQRNFSGELERTRRINSQLADDSDFAARIAEAEGKGWREILDIQKESAKKQLENADNLIEDLHDKQRKAKGKLSDAEKEALQEAQDMQKEAWKAVLKLNDDYNVQEAAERTAAAKQRKEDLKAELARRKELLIQAAEDERTVKEVLYNLDASNRPKDKFDAQVELQNYKAPEREQEEETDVASFQSVIEYNTKRMQLEMATEDEIYQYRVDMEMKYWQKKLATAEVGSQEYIDISNKIADMEIENNNRVAESNAQKLQDIINIAGNILQTLGQMTDEIFGAVSDNIQAQIDQLDEMYTTDAEEAKNDASKKYISEKELEEKKAKLKLRQQKLDKANAIFQIGLSTAMAIMSIWAQVPKVDFGVSTIALTATAAALGATQLAIAAAKPLSQYAKGRKGGQGEYALVGEKGAEIMYVPQGASIIPHNKIDQPGAWGAYGVPQLPIPASANINPVLLDQAVAASQWQPIDYDRLGQAVAKAMPRQRAVNVNVDRHGVTVQSGNDIRTYLNTKYQAQW